MKTNKCSCCSRKIGFGVDLLKLKDDKWYCTICICSYEPIFNLIKKNSYWFHLLRKLINFRNTTKEAIL